MLARGGGPLPVVYRLGVSAFVCDGPAGHDWTALSRLPVRHYEIGTLHGADTLEGTVETLRPGTFGIHWPLRVADGHDYHLLASSPEAFEVLLVRIRDSITATGTRYVLVHLGQRGEPWPDQVTVSRRLTDLAACAADLGVEIVLEPKESVAHGDGLSGFVERLPVLPAGLALCVDSNDWASAGRHLRRGPECLAGRAAYFHIHSLHVRPDSGGLYLHAPPWVAPGDDPPWPELRQPEAADLEVMAERGRAVTVQIEVHPRYRARLPEAIAAVRAHLARLGWREVDG